jgi:hypothetical protein
LRENRAADYAALKANRRFGEARRAIRSSYAEVVRRICRSSKRKWSASTAPERPGRAWKATSVDPAGGSNLCKGARVLPDREKLMPVLAGDRYQTILKDFPER